MSELQLFRRLRLATLIKDDKPIASDVLKPGDEDSSGVPLVRIGDMQ